MSRQLFVSPEEQRKPGKIVFQDIIVNSYQKKVKDELEQYTKEEFLHMYRDMAYIREFETMLHCIKTKMEYGGVPYDHPGPAHLGMGQEAMYIGEAFCLTLDDYTFGSHRSHGEILSRGMRTVETLDTAELLDIMKKFQGGKTLAAVDDGSTDDVRELGRRFFLYGMMCETFARKNGFNCGLGGSMHAFFTPFGIYPNNAIVGGSGSIAPGAALYKLINKKPGIVVCNIGDGAMSCGPVWEGLMISNMGQIKNELCWGELGGGVPLIYNINDNFYGMGGQTNAETTGCEMMARIAAGLSPTQMYVERVDAYNPLAVIDAYKRKIPVAKEKGPVMLDMVTYRVSGHSPADPGGTYRTDEELEAWENQDSIKAFGKEMIDANLTTQEELDQIYSDVVKEMVHTLSISTNPEISPVIDATGREAFFIENVMFSNERVESMDTDREPVTNIPLEEIPRVKQIATKKRFAFDENGKAYSNNSIYRMRDAIVEPIIRKFYKDPTFVSFGEDLRDYGGSFGLYRGITEGLPYNRLFNTPIAEAGIMGAAVGYGMSGGRVCCEIMFTDFLGRCADEVFNQLSKWQSMSAGMIKMPVVVRMSVGNKYGAQHSQDWSAILTHIPGLKVVFPATPYDARGLMESALNGTDPVIFLESQRLYDIGEEFHQGGVPVEDYEITIGEPDIKRIGKDLTILTVGASLYTALKAADIFETEYGISTEVIDARSLVPFNYDPVIESVKKTGKIIIVGDACERTSFMRNLASNITEMAFDYLDAPPTVVGAREWIVPAYELEKAFFPQPEWIVDAFHEKIKPLRMHTCISNQKNDENKRRSFEGV